MSRPTLIHINLPALRHNCAVARECAPESGLVAVIKADAYGHGAVEIARALLDMADMFAVSCLEEAMELRQGGIRTPLLLLEGCFSAEEYEQVARQDIQVVVHSELQVEQLIAAELDNSLTVWLKVDSGMHRLGIAPENVTINLSHLQSTDNVSEVILMTHLASADEPDGEFTRLQLACFSSVCYAGNATEASEFSRSIANSAGVLAWPEAHVEWIRPGIMLYGLSPFGAQDNRGDQLRPVMTLKSKVIALRSVPEGECVGYGNTWKAKRPSVIATVAVGYGDGYPRTAQSGTPVMVNGIRAELAGRVSMDMITVDVTEVTQVEIGDDVELWGENLSVNEVAGWAGSIGYELVTRMPRRTPRRYIPG